MQSVDDFIKSYWPNATASEHALLRDAFFRFTEVQKSEINLRVQSILASHLEELANFFPSQAEAKPFIQKLYTLIESAAPGQTNPRIPFYPFPVQ